MTPEEKLDDMLEGADTGSDTVMLDDARVIAIAYAKLLTDPLNERIEGTDKRQYLLNNRKDAVQIVQKKKLSKKGGGK